MAPGYSNTIRYDHGSTLRTVQEIFGLTPLLGGAATATDLSDLFSSFGGGGGAALTCPGPGNPRQNGSCQHIEITCRTRGPVVRSEACSDDFYAALDLAVDKLERRMRHAADRRRIHHGRRTPRSVAEVTVAI